MTIYVSKSPLQENQLGISVSKKFSKSSVKRNRVKRLLKEAYRLNEEHFLIGYRIIILWKNQVAYDEVSFDGVRCDLLKCFKKAKLLKIEEECNV